MYKQFKFLALILTLSLLTSSCTRLFRKEPVPPPAPMKTGLIAPADGSPIEDSWAQSIGEGVYKIGKPYKVNGVWYFPKEDYNYDEVGYASWYGPDFHNKRTANGEIFDMNMLSAAHKTLPLPSVVRVTNLQNGRSLVLRVNDRGPFVNDRILDVSKKAAQLLGFKDQGTTKIRLELLPEESMTVASLAQNANYISPSKIKPAQSGEVFIADDLENIDSFGSHDTNPSGKHLPGGTLENSDGSHLFDDQPVTSLSRREVENNVAVISEEDYNRQLESSLRGDTVPHDTTMTPSRAPAPVQVTPAPAAPRKQVYIQAGAFGRMENAERVSQKLQCAGSTNISKIETSRGTLYKVRVGPFENTAQARQAMQTVVSKGHPDAHIITQ